MWCVISSASVLGHPPLRSTDRNDCRSQSISPSDGDVVLVSQTGLYTVCEVFQHVAVDGCCMALLCVSMKPLLQHQHMLWLTSRRGATLQSLIHLKVWHVANGLLRRASQRLCAGKHGMCMQVSSIFNENGTMKHKKGMG